MQSHCWAHDHTCLGDSRGWTQHFPHRTPPVSIHICERMNWCQGQAKLFGIDSFRLSFWNQQLNELNGLNIEWYGNMVETTSGALLSYTAWLICILLGGGLKMVNCFLKSWWICPLALYFLYVYPDYLDMASALEGIQVNSALLARVLCLNWCHGPGKKVNAQL